MMADLHTMRMPGRLNGKVHLACVDKYTRSRNMDLINHR